MIQDNIMCPKCNKQGLRKSHGKNPQGEFFCDIDRVYFSIWELVNIWGFDAGDFVNNNGVSLLPNRPTICTHDYLMDYPPFIPKRFQYATQCMDCFEIFYEDEKSDTVSNSEDVNFLLQTSSEFSGEPMWQSNQEREEAYEMVHRMFMGIPEYDDYQDLKNTQNSALDIGVQ